MKTLKIFSLRTATLLIVLLLPNCIVHAQTDVAAAARANRTRARSENTGSEWYKATRVSLREEAQEEAGNILYEISGNNDLKITIDSTEKGKQQTSQIMLINGRCQWMLAKNLPLEKGYEIDALDGAVLNLKLALELLRAAVPGGPGEIKQKMPVSIHEAHRSIALSTASASGGIQAPWSLEGTIEPITEKQTSFELTMKTSETVHLSGVWQREATPPAFADEMPLDDWQVFSIGPMTIKDESGTIYDYGAQISRKHPRTLGELRGIDAK
jgi:hypothetical protein